MVGSNARALAWHVHVLNGRGRRGRGTGRDVGEDGSSVRPGASRRDGQLGVLEGVGRRRDGGLRNEVGHVGLRHGHHSRLESGVRRRREASGSRENPGPRWQMERSAKRPPSLAPEACSAQRSGAGLRPLPIKFLGVRKRYYAARG